MRRGGKALLRAKTLRHKLSYLATNPFVHRKVSRQTRLMRTHSTVSARLARTTIKFKRANYEISAPSCIVKLSEHTALKSMQASSYHALIARLTAGRPPFASNLKTRALMLQKARVFGAVGFVLIARRQFAPQTLF
jgi:hypothetical protein